MQSSHYILSLILTGCLTSASQHKSLLRSYAITDPNNIALWLSGYFNGKRGNTIVNVQSFKDNVEKVKDYCITNPKVTVMRAVEEILSKGN